MCSRTPRHRLAALAALMAEPVELVEASDELQALGASPGQTSAALRGVRPADVPPRGPGREAWARGRLAALGRAL